MSATSRELVLQALNREAPARVPRDLWTLPIATETHREEYAGILRDFPPDFEWVSGHERQLPPCRGDQFRAGEYVDAWGARFTNVQDGVIGEVKEPLVRDWNADRRQIHIPREWLTIDRDAINRDCGESEKFVFAKCVWRPFEQLQFLRGTEDLYCDLLDSDSGLWPFLREMHSFHTELLQVWARTDVDGFMVCDDWGAQHSMLISPALWRHYFKPIYRDFVQIAHGRGKKLFMHSDGYILNIYPDLVEIGIDAVNSQLFCMGIENLEPFAGRITFYGEIDRQHLLPNGTPDEIDRAVRQVHATLWRDGGCIAQCEFGAAARPENVRQVFASWNAVSDGRTTDHYEQQFGRRGWSRPSLQR
jgi:hypothetical protein